MLRLEVCEALGRPSDFSHLSSGTGGAQGRPMALERYTKRLRDYDRRGAFQRFTRLPSRLTSSHLLAVSPISFVPAEASIQSTPHFYFEGWLF